MSILKTYWQQYNPSTYDKLKDIQKWVSFFAFTITYCYDQLIKILFIFVVCNIKQVKNIWGL
jgi:hypothetical protein